MSELIVHCVDLDDSRVVNIHRSPGQLVIVLAQKRHGETKRITVGVSGLVKESAEYYVGHKVTAQHPNPSFPLDFIQFAEQGPDHLELGGHLKNEPWYVWRITATQIEIKHSNDV